MSIDNVSNGKYVNVKQLIENYFYIVDKSSNTTLLKLNSAQLKVYNAIRQCKLNHKPARLLILKARQLGMSTFTEALGCGLCITKHNQDMLVMTHRADTTDNLFMMTKHYVQHLPEVLKPSITKDNENELVFNTKDGNGLNSKVKVMTASKLNQDGVGRGHTFTYAHLSEFDFWQCDNTKVLAGILSACTNDSIVIIETTANGCNTFKSMWDKAVSSDSGWIPLFFPWFQAEEYEREVVNYSEFEKTLNEEELELIKIFKSDDETKDLSMERYLRKLMWRRIKLTTDMNGSLDMFHQEFPSTPEEAFISSGDIVFNNTLISRRKRYLELNPKIYDIGYYDYEIGFDIETQKRYLKSYKWISDKRLGYIKKYEKPINNVPYIVSTDPAGSGSDFTATIGINNITCEQVVQLHKDKMSSLEIAIQSMCIGYEYNTALINSETNYAPEVIQYYKEFEYPNIYVQEDKSGIGDRTVKKYGFRMTPFNRGSVIDNLKNVLGTKNCLEECTKLYLVNSFELLKEGLTFVKTMKEDDSGVQKFKEQASNGSHDDLLMAYGEALEIRKEGQQSFSKIDSSETISKYANEFDPLDMYSTKEEYEQEAIIYDEVY